MKVTRGSRARKLRTVQSAESLLSLRSNLSTIRDSRQYSGEGGHILTRNEVQNLYMLVIFKLVNI